MCVGKKTVRHIETEWNKGNVYQEKNGSLNGVIYVLLWDIMQLNERTCKVMCLV